MRALFGAILLLAVAGGGPAASAETFKPFTLKTLEGTPQSLPDLGGKATLVIFFSPTCTYCKASLPAITKIHEAHKDRGLAIVWINVVPEEERLIAAWRAEHSHTMPILLGGSSVQRDYRLSMTPTYYLIDLRRTVLWKHAGYKPGDEAAIERAIEAALPG